MQTSTTRFSASEVPRQLPKVPLKISPFSATAQLLIWTIGFTFIEAFVIGKQFIEAGFNIYQLGPEYVDNKSQASEDWAQVGVKPADVASYSEQTANGNLQFSLHRFPLGVSLAFSEVMLGIYIVISILTGFLLYAGHSTKIFNWTKPMDDEAIIDDLVNDRLAKVGERSVVKANSDSRENEIQDHEPLLILGFWKNDARNDSVLLKTTLYRLLTFPTKMYQALGPLPGAWRVIVAIMFAQFFGLDDYCKSVGKEIFDLTFADKLHTLMASGDCAYPMGTNLTCRGTAGNTAKAAEDQDATNTKMSSAGQAFYFLALAMGLLFAAAMILSTKKSKTPAAVTSGDVYVPLVNSDGDDEADDLERASADASGSVEHSRRIDSIRSDRDTIVRNPVAPGGRHDSSLVSNIGTGAGTGEAGLGAHHAGFHTLSRSPSPSLVVGSSSASPSPLSDSTV